MRDLCGNQLVSVIMPCYNMGEYIYDALESIARQSYKNLEIVVVDDAGNDIETNKSLGVFENKYSDISLKYIRHKENRGVSAARNTAIKNSEGYFLAFLDPDDYWGDTYLEVHLESLQANPDTSVSFTSVLRVDKDRNMLSEVVGPTDSELEEFPYSLYRRNFIAPSGVVCKKSVVDAVGGFDEDARMQHIEDWDMWLRLLEYGAKFGHLDTAVSYYRWHSSAATSKAEMMRKLKVNLRAKHMYNDKYRNYMIDYLCGLEEDVFRMRSEINRIESSKLQTLLRRMFSRFCD